MIIQIDRWVFDVDMDATMAYSAEEAEEHCTCGYCRNFYEAVDLVYPDLRPSLARFGVHVEAPDKLIPYTPTMMEGFYAVCGKVLRHGSSPMSISGINISVADPDDLHGIAPLPEPFFVLNTGFMELPWILDEQMDDVVSPANEPSYLQEMTNRILGLYPTENIQ